MSKYYHVFTACGDSVQYTVTPASTDIASYAERKNSEGTINGKFVC